MLLLLSCHLITCFIKVVGSNFNTDKNNLIYSQQTHKERDHKSLNQKNPKKDFNSVLSRFG